MTSTTISPPKARLVTIRGRPRGAATKTSDLRLTSFSLTDTLSIADGHLLITAGVRKQQIAQNFYGAGAYSPLLWIVLKPLYNLSLYGNYSAGNPLRVPSWIRYDIGARYNTNVAGKPVVLRASIDNLFNKNYWLFTSAYSYLGVAPARTLLLSAQVDF